MAAKAVMDATWVCPSSKTSYLWTRAFCLRWWQLAVKAVLIRARRESGRYKWVSPIGNLPTSHFSEPRFHFGQQHFIRVLMVLSSRRHTSRRLSVLVIPKSIWSLSSMSFRTRSMYPSAFNCGVRAAWCLNFICCPRFSFLFLSKVRYSVVIGLLFVLSVGLGWLIVEGRHARRLQNTYTPLRLMDEHIIRFSFCGLVPTFCNCASVFFFGLLERKWRIYHSAKQSSLQVILWTRVVGIPFQSRRKSCNGQWRRYNTTDKTTGGVNYGWDW